MPESIDYCANCGGEFKDGGLRWKRAGGLEEYCSRECADCSPAQIETGETGDMTKFETGATRSAEEGKLDPEGFLHPAVLRRYCQYLNKHRVQADGKMRDSDNWQKGMPIDRYMKSKMRHVFDTWLHHRGQGHLVEYDDILDCLCAELFNTQGMILEILIERGEVKRDA